MALLSDLLTTCSRLRSLYVVSYVVGWFDATIGSLAMLLIPFTATDSERSRCRFGVGSVGTLAVGVLSAF